SRRRSAARSACPRRRRRVEQTHPSLRLQLPPAPELASHSDGGLATLIVLGQAGQLAVSEPLIERLRAVIRCPHFEEHRGDAGYERRLLQPLHQLSSEPCSSIGVAHTEEV